MILVDAALLMSLSGAPFGPSLTVETQPIEHVYFKQTTSSICHPQQIHRWNPVTVHFGIEAGLDYNDIKIGLGHMSNHYIDGYSLPLNSYDYIKVGFRKVWR